MLILAIQAEFFAEIYAQGLVLLEKSVRIDLFCVNAMSSANFKLPIFMPVQILRRGPARYPTLGGHGWKPMALARKTFRYRL